MLLAIMYLKYKCEKKDTSEGGATLNIQCSTKKNPMRSKLRTQGLSIKKGVYFSGLPFFRYFDQKMGAH